MAFCLGQSMVMMVLARAPPRNEEARNAALGRPGCCAPPHPAIVGLGREAPAQVATHNIREWQCRCHTDEG